MGKTFDSVFYSLLMILGTVTAYAQNATKIKWLSFDQVEALRLENPRKKIMVDLYTDNCAFCRKLDLSTFQNEFISHYLNENFFPVRFNAQHKKDIIFDKKLFKLDNSGYHELAIVLSLGDLGFPTLVFLDEDNQIIQPIQGYQTVDELERIMYYFANDIYLNTPWNEFVSRFKPTNSKPKMEFHKSEMIPPSLAPSAEPIKKKN